MDEKETDKALFRQSATLIAGGFFLIFIGKPTLIPVFGILLLVVSVLFLVVAILELFNKAHRLTKCCRSLGDSLTLIFIVLSTVGVLSKWAEIKADTVAGKPLAIASEQWLEPIRQFLVNSSFFIGLIVAFWVILDVALLFIAIKQARKTWKESGPRQASFSLGAGLLLVLGVLGMLVFAGFSSISDDILFGVSALAVLGLLFYLTRQNAQPRSKQMDQKDRIRDSVTSIETSACLIRKLTTLDCPHEILKEILQVPLKHLEDGLQCMKREIDSLK